MPYLAVPNVTAYPSTASVPITIWLYNGLLLCSFSVLVKELNFGPNSDYWSKKTANIDKWGEDVVLCTARNKAAGKLFTVVCSFTKKTINFEPLTKLLIKFCIWRLSFIRESKPSPSLTKRDPKMFYFLQHI